MSEPVPEPIPAARALALDLLQAVLRRRRALDEALEMTEPATRLATRDKAFARLLVATTLRRLGQIDALLAEFLDRPLKANAREVEDILRLGVTQLLFLDTPPHAAVNTSVQLVVHRGHSFARGLVNAVLRRVDREGRALAAQQDAERLNTPLWLWERWQRHYGSATARAIATAHLAVPPLDVTVKNEGEEKPWARRIGGEVLPTGSIRYTGGGAVTELAGFEAGQWWVQDAAAALPARLLLAALPDGGREAAIADLCAAPGGKTAQLAAAGARVTAVDMAPRRLRLVEDNLARLGLRAELVAADATAWAMPARFDGVLLDAPCSATGTIRRHPDVALLKGPHDLARLVRIQSRLLDAAARLVRPGGVLVYGVCSLEPEEGEERIAAFLASGVPFRREPIGAVEVGGLGELIAPSGDLRTLPCHLADQGGLDGFFAARLRHTG